MREHLDPSVTIADALAFLKKKSIVSVALVKSGAIAGLIHSRDLERALSTPTGWSDYSRTEVNTLMDPFPMIFDLEFEVADLLSIALKRSLEKRFDDVIAAGDGGYAGMVSIKRLLSEQPGALPHLFRDPQPARDLCGEFAGENTHGVRGIVASSRNPHLEGCLETIDIADCLQLLINGRKTGRLDLQTAHEMKTAVYSVFFSRGSIVHSCGEGREGIDAFWKVLSLNKGRFRFLSGIRSGVQSIADNPMHLLLEGCRMLDESLAGVS
jgi:hypothetical protein